MKVNEMQSIMHDILSLFGNKSICNTINNGGKSKYVLWIGWMI